MDLNVFTELLSCLSEDELQMVYAFLLHLVFPDE